jgi:N-acetylneuraminate synthase
MNYAIFRSEAYLRIDAYEIVPHCRPYLIAELSANHRGTISRLYDLIAAARNAGADAVKLQCYDPETISADITLSEGPWAGRSTRDLYREAHTPRDWFEWAFDWAHHVGITAFASVFSEADADFIQRFEPPAYKISSFDIVDSKLIRHVAQFGKPLIISTGGATTKEIMAADMAAGSCPHLFLHCVSEYPTPIENANLGRLHSFRGFVRPFMVGLSDHSLGHDIAVAATAMGVVAIEKHFILSRSDGGPDAAFSMEPEEYRAMASAVQAVHAAVSRAPPEPRRKSSFYRKSLFYARDIAAGARLSETDVRTMRPALGIHPALLPSVVGRYARRALAAGSPVAMGDLASAPE